MKRKTPFRTVALVVDRISVGVPVSLGLQSGTLSLLLAALISGCAHRANVSLWQPAQAEVSDLKMLAVAGFSGEHGAAVAAAVRSQLCDHEFSPSDPTTDFQAVRWISATTGHRGLLSLDDLQAIREAGIDGLVVGDVVEYRCDDHPVAETSLFWGLIPHRDQPASENDDGARENHASTGAVRRDAAVAITFRLVDAHTGEIRAMRETSHSITETLDGGTTDPRRPAEVLDQLTRQCVDEFVRTLVTHRTVASVTLARPAPFTEGYALVVNGNEFATRGRWEEAMAAWEQAVARNPENDAALFNLSLAHLSLQNFRKAESFAIRALNLRHNETYQAGLERIRQQASALDQPLPQHRALELVRANGTNSGEEGL